MAKKAGTPLPLNSDDGLRRNLDCAVINHLHHIRREARLAPVDTVKGVFIEGNAAYPNAGIYEKTHIQVCVTNPAMIKAAFRVTEDMLKSA